MATEEYSIGYQEGRRDGWNAAMDSLLPAQRKPLTLGQKQKLWSSVGHKPTLKDRVNAYGLAIEAAHNIKENT